MTARKKISSTANGAVARIFSRLDYRKLGPIYCYEGGDTFWRRKREPCVRLGKAVAQGLLHRLPPGGRSLYVGAGVAEIPSLVVEILDLHRSVVPYNLRRAEVISLNQSCTTIPLRFQAKDASMASGTYDHVWIVSVLNDPERFPHLSPLSYGRADPVSFNPARFERERRLARRIVNRCLPKLTLPGLVTTSVEEVVWIADWCHRHRVPYLVERRAYPTALVGDPICFIKIGEWRSRRLKV
jgi:hypothetical protein